jgi:hypothetical protein
MTSDEYERSKPVMEIKTKILATRLRAGHCTKDVLFEAADRLDALLEDLKMVLAREAKTQARHDDKLDAQDDENADWQSEAMHQNALLHDALTRAEVAEAKLAKAVAALAAIGNAKTSGGGQAGVLAFHAREALAEIKGE